MREAASLQLSSEQTSGAAALVFGNNALISVPETPEETYATECSIDISGEVYGGSFRVKRALGEVAINERLNTSEGRAIYDGDYDDWRSSLGEMLKTAESLRRVVEVNREKNHKVEGDKVLASDNKTYMDDLVEAGEASARATAKKAAQEGDDLTARIMEVQAQRDGSDVWNVHRVNDIVAGRIVADGRTVNRRTVVSMFPEEPMNQDGDEPWNELKYLRGLAYVQDYYFDGQHLQASTYSISFADKNKLRDFLNNRMGFAIPEDAHTSDWVRYGREDVLGIEEPSILLQQLREGYYESIGRQGLPYSTETLMDAQEQMMRQAFESLNLPLAESIASTEKHAVIHEFAAQLLTQADIFSPEVVRGLMRIVACGKFDDTDGRLMDELIRYSVAEGLQKYALSVADTGQSIEVYMKQVETQGAPSLSGPIAPGALLRMVTSQIIEGARRGHSYGGCPGKRFRVSKKDPGYLEEMGGPQDAFGGNDILDNPGEETQSLPKSIRCIKCRQYSPKEKVVHRDYWCCPKCSYKIDVCTGEELHASSVDKKQESAKPSAGAVVLSFTLRKRRQAEKAAA